MKVYVVTEYRIDYDDYPIGSGEIIKVFTDKVQAQIFSSYDNTPSRKTRRVAETELDDTESGYENWKEYCDVRWPRNTLSTT